MIHFQKRKIVLVALVCMVSLMAGSTQPIRPAEAPSLSEPTILIATEELPMIEPTPEALLEEALQETPAPIEIRQAQASRGNTEEYAENRVVMEDCQVTYYNNVGISYETFTGTRTVDGVTAAVDPNVIKLGSWMEIHMPDGTILKRRAEDTGSAVKGKVVDIYADRTTEELLRRGRVRGVKIVIVGN